MLRLLRFSSVGFGVLPIQGSGTVQSHSLSWHDPAIADGAMPLCCGGSSGAGAYATVAPRATAAVTLIPELRPPPSPPPRAPSSARKGSRSRRAGGAPPDAGASGTRCCRCCCGWGAYAASSSPVCTPRAQPGQRPFVYVSNKWQRAAIHIRVYTRTGAGEVMTAVHRGICPACQRSKEDKIVAELWRNSCMQFLFEA